MMKNQRLKLPIFFLFVLGLSNLPVVDASDTKEATKKECQFSGTIGVQIFSREPDGNWLDWDRLDAPKASFDFKVSPIAAQEMRVETKYEYVGVTLNGRRVRIKLKDPGNLRYEPTLGVVQLEISFKLEMDGERIGVPLKLTTEAARSPKGEAHGTRVQVRNDVHGATLSLVGGSMFSGPASLEESRTATGGKMQTRTREYLVLIQSQGTVNLK